MSALQRIVASKEQKMSTGLGPVQTQVRILICVTLIVLFNFSEPVSSSEKWK